jgi:hypothetical protein
MLNIFKSKRPTPDELAEQAQRILSGQCRKWDVDGYENANPQDPRLKDLHIRTLKFGLPEEWSKLEGAAQSTLREIIEEMRRVGSLSDFDPRV